MERLEMMISWLPSSLELPLDSMLDLHILDSLELHISEDCSHLPCELSHSFIHDLSLEGRERVSHLEAS